MANLVTGLGNTLDPLNVGFGDNFLPATDDGSSGPIDITAAFGPSGIDLFGTDYTSIYINNNGNITFDGPLFAFTASALGSGYTGPIIAPFWADVDTLGGAAPVAGQATASVVTPTGGGSDGTDLVWYDVSAATQTVTVTWDDVGYYGEQPGAGFKPDAFQLQLTKLANGETDIRFIYQTIDWTTGAASGGTNGLGGFVAQAGYAAGTGSNAAEITASGNGAALLALPTTIGNTGQAGVYNFILGANDGFAPAIAVVVTAQPATPGTVDFGAVHVGDDTLNTALFSEDVLAITNAAIAPADGLDVSATPADAAAVAAGSVGQGTMLPLAPGETDDTNVLVGIATATDGVQTGTVDLGLATDGRGASGAIASALPGQSVVTTGTVYAYAAPEAAQTLDLGAARIGDPTLSGTLVIGDGTTADPFQESLLYDVGTEGSSLPSPFSATGGATGLVASGNSQGVGFSLDTSKAGDFDGSLVSVAYTSTGAGTSGLGNTALGTGTVVLNGRVYQAATASVSPTPLDFGIVHVGDNVETSVSVSNVADPTQGLSDVLLASVSSNSGGFVSNGDDDTISAGNSGTLGFFLDTASAGLVTGTATLSLASHDGDLSDLALSAPELDEGDVLDLTGTVDNYAMPVFTPVAIGEGDVFTQTDATDYVLNLGTYDRYDFANIDTITAGNGATGPADLLDGMFDVAGGAGSIVVSLPDGFTDAGAGQVGATISVQADTTMVGVNTETLVLQGVGHNASGYSGATAPVTLVIEDDVLPSGPSGPSGPAYASGSDVGSSHITTFDGLTYDFQAVGEFVLAEDADFTVQIRTQSSGLVSTIEQVAVGIGTSRVTFDPYRSSTVYLNGAPLALAPGQFLTLPAGTVYAMGGGIYRVVYGTGEVVNITGGGLGVGITVPGNDAGGTKGLLGPDDGDQSTDFTLPDGTVLQQPLSTAQVQQTFGNTWRVTQATSLLDYAAGQTTATFTNLGYQPAPVTVANLPADVIAKARAVVAALGVTDPIEQQNAILDDVLTTGTLNAAAAIASEYADLYGATPLALTPAPIPEEVGLFGPTGPVGVGSDEENASSVTFEVFRTGPDDAPVTIDYAVVDPGVTGYVPASAYLGALPSGSVTFAAGVDETDVSIPLPTSLALPSETLQIAVSSPTENVSVATPTVGAILDSVPEVRGIDAVPQVVLGTGLGTLTSVGNAVTIALGSIGADGVSPIDFVVENTAAAGANFLGGTFSLVSGSGFGLTAPAFSGVGPGEATDTEEISVSTLAAGAQSETFVLDPTSSNASGYSGTLSRITLTITDTVVSPTAAPAPLPKSETLLGRIGIGFTNTVTIDNAAPAGSDLLAVTATDIGGHVDLVEPNPIPATTSTPLALSESSDQPSTFVDTLDLAYSSVETNGANHPPVTLPGASVVLDGTLYNPATAELLSGLTLDLGSVQQGGTFAPGTIEIDNIAQPGVLSDSLLGSGVSDNLVSFAGGSLDVAPGGTGALTLNLSSATAGVVTDYATIEIASHDAAQADAPLQSEVVAVTGTVVGDATPVFQETAGPGALTETSPTSFNLFLGTFTLGAATQSYAIDVENAAVPGSDAVSGTLSLVSPDFAFPLGSFAALGPGATSEPIDLDFSTAALGTFTQTIVLNSTDSGVGVLPAETLTVTGQVLGDPSSPPCFAAGTRLATPGGEVRVEDLRAGQAVLTAAGDSRPILWIGSRGLDFERAPASAALMPVRIAEGAFGAGRPWRDLLLSPDHAVSVDGVLVPVRELLNGRTIVRTSVARVRYFHVELDTHDVLLAEGLPAESYLDTGNRAAFANGGVAAMLRPDFGRLSSGGSCEPVVVRGPMLARIRARLDAIADALPMPRGGAERSRRALPVGR